MRTYLIYFVLGIIGFLIIKFANIELNLKTIIIGLISIPIVEYLINFKHHRENALSEKMKQMSKQELDELLGIGRKQLSEFISKEPTNPQSFGYKASWIVVKSKSIESVLKTIEYDQIVTTNWEIGVNSTFENRTFKFISPPINNWVIILGDKFNYVNTIELKSKLSRLSTVFGEAYYYSSFRGTGHASWAKYINGNEIRAFLIDDGNLFYSHGELEKEEFELIEKRRKEINHNDKEQIEFYEKLDYQNLLGTEDDVLMMARKWTINPMELHTIQKKELGYLIE